MKLFSRVSTTGLVLAALWLLTGCASVSQRTNEYLGAPKYPPSNPATVQILQGEPQRAKERLGEIILSVDGKPKREDLEKRLREGAAELGADAVFIAYDKMHVYPMVYGDWWWGPTYVSEDSVRKVVGVAIKFK